MQLSFKGPNYGEHCMSKGINKGEITAKGSMVSVVKNFIKCKVAPPRNNVDT